jgi:hypothetical protein
MAAIIGIRKEVDSLGRYVKRDDLFSHPLHIGAGPSIMNDIDLKKTFMPASYSDVRLDTYDFSVYDQKIITPEMRKVEEALSAELIPMQNRIDFYTTPYCVYPAEKSVKLFSGSDSKVTQNRLMRMTDSIRRQPFNHEILNEAACIFQALAHQAIRKPDRAVTAPDINKISSGGNGAVIEGLFSSEYSEILFPKDKPSAFFLKIPFEKSGGAEAVNELIVGLYALNAIRAVNPNFMFTYGGFYAPAPEVVKKRGKNHLERIFNKNINQSLMHIMVENLPNNGTLNDWVMNQDLSDPLAIRRIYEIIFQINLALGVAFDMFEFSHNDLHSGNILIHELSEPRMITYRMGGFIFHLTTDVIATMIDFGHSRALVPFTCERDLTHIAPNLIRHVRGNLYSFATGGIYSTVGFTPEHSTQVYDMARFSSSLMLSIANNMAEKNELEYILTRRADGKIYIDHEIVAGGEWLSLLMSPSTTLFEYDRFVDWVSRCFSVSPIQYNVDPAEFFLAGVMKLAAANNKYLTFFTITPDPKQSGRLTPKIQALYEQWYKIHGHEKQTHGRAFACSTVNISGDKCDSGLYVKAHSAVEVAQQGRGLKMGSVSNEASVISALHSFAALEKDYNAIIQALTNRTHSRETIQPYVDQFFIKARKLNEIFLNFAFYERLYGPILPPENTHKRRMSSALEKIDEWANVLISKMSM